MSDEKPCYCDSRQCDICTPEPRGDLAKAVAMLAADNARMCDILIAADKLAEACADVLADHPILSRKLARALDTFVAVRNGQ